MGDIVGGATASNPAGNPAAPSGHVGFGTVLAGWRGVMLVMLILAVVLNYVDRQIIAVLKPMLQAELGWSDTEYGLLASAFQFSAAIALLFAGWFVDRVGWARANPYGVGAWSIAAMGHALVHTVGQFVFVRAALGATEAVGTPAALKTVAVWFRPEERSVAWGMVNAGANLGAIMTPLLAPALALAFGWRATFLIMGGLGLVWVLVWWAMISTRKLDRPPMAPATQAPAAIAGGNKVPWRIILRDRRTWAISGAKAMTDQTWWFLLFWMPDLLNRVFGLDMKSFGVPLATIYGAAGLGSIFAGYLAGRVLSSGVEINRARKSMMLVYALLVTPVPLVLMTDNHWIAVVLLSMTLAAHQGFSVNLFGVITDIIPASRVASVTAVSALCGNITGMLVLQLAGIVLDRTGSYAPLLLLAASSYLIGLAWLHLLLPKLRPAEEA